MDLDYKTDVEPHLQRASIFRKLRNKRMRDLKSARFWRFALPFLAVFWGLVAYGIHAC